MKIGILEPEGFSKKALKILKNIGEVSLYKKDNPIKEFIKDKDIIFIRLRYYISKELLEKSSVKIVCSPTTGFNHIDLDYLNKEKIKYISLKDEYEFLSNIRATPEHTFGLVLALLRNYKKVFCNNCSFKDRDKLKGEEIFGKNIGIIGLGRVGKVLARYFEVFGANVFYNDIKKIDCNYTFLSKKDLIKKSDIILLCANYLKENQDMIDKDLLDLMCGKYFINTARGELINENHLLELLEKNHFKGVALDVIKDELNSKKFLELKKYGALVTPHIAGATYESMHKTEEFMVKKLKEIL